MVILKSHFNSSIIAILVIALVIALADNAAVLSSQSGGDDESRGLKPREYAKGLEKRVKKNRPNADKPNSAQNAPQESASYVPIDSENELIVQGMDVGVIFWKLRETAASDDAAVVEQQRIAKRVKSKVVETDVNLTPVRAMSETRFSDGDLMRLSIELPIEGYVYIINRERYADGKYSDPYLIFPNKSDIDRTDRATAGRLLYIPNEKDYFELTSLVKEGARKTAEVFTVIVTAEIIKELPPLVENEEPRKIDSRKFEEWRNKWGGKVLRFEREGGEGKIITKVEKNASITGSEVLTQDSPTPQTIFHIAGKRKAPLLFNIPVQIRN